MDWQALGVSLKVASGASILLLIVGLPLAVAVLSLRNPWRSLLEAFCTLPFVLPPTVLGFYLLVGLAPWGWAFSLKALLLGAVIFNLPIGVQSFVSSIQMVDPRLIEAAKVLGWGPWHRFFYVVLPLCWSGLMAGVMLIFAHTFGEFGIAMMVGGNLQGETRTLAISLYDQVQGFETAAAHRTAIFQLGLSFVFLVSIALLKKGETFAFIIRTKGRRNR